MALTFGVLLLQDRSLSEVVTWAQRYELAGADSIWVADHLANPFALELPWLDAWLTLAAIANGTTTCEIGPLVSTFVLHPPLAMARRIDTLAKLSGDRAVLGLGAGGAPVDRSVGRIDDESTTALVTRLDRGIDALRRLLAGEAHELASVPSIGGRSAPTSIRVTGARPAPILVGGQGPRLLEVAARRADRWNTFRPGPGRPDELDSFAESNRNVSRLCEDAGRDPVSLRRSILIDFTEATTAPDRTSLRTLVLQLRELGYEEYIAYAWADRHISRSPEELEEFIADDLPSLRE